MKTFMKSALVLAATACVMYACSRPGLPSRTTVPYVESVIAGNDQHALGILESVSHPRPSGSIVLLGRSEQCATFADRFAACDERDNVDARLAPDGLPDFAGETLVCIADDSPSGDLRDSAAAVAFREKTVRKVIAALDTVVHVSPYDIQGMSSKAPAKLVILGDPLMSEFGAFDVDTLFRSTGCDVPVIAPMDCMLDKLFSRNSGRALNVGILADLSYADSLMYAGAFDKAAAAHSSSDSRCFVFPSQAGSDSLLLHSLVASYASRFSRPLDAVIVNDLQVNVDSLKSELADMISVMSKSSMTYGRLIARDFVLLDGFSEVVSHCHAIMRERNIFTHNISFVQTETYVPVAKPDTDDGSIILIPASYVQN